MGEHFDQELLLRIWQTLGNLKKTLRATNKDKNAPGAAEVLFKEIENYIRTLAKLSWLAKKDPDKHMPTSQLFSKKNPPSKRFTTAILLIFQPERFELAPSGSNFVLLDAMYETVSAKVHRSQKQDMNSQPMYRDPPAKCSDLPFDPNLGTHRSYLVRSQKATRCTMPMRTHI